MSTIQPDLVPAVVTKEPFWQRMTSPHWRWTLFVAVGAVLILVAWLGLGKIPTTTFDLTRHSIPLDQIVDGGPGKDGIPAILSPRFVPAAAATFLQDTDRVLGLSVAGEARAYPIKILNWHEIVNDTFDGKPVVVTYCPLCGTGIAFDADFQGRRHTYGVSGLLYESDLLMYDHQTESLWSQIRMEAVAGPMTGQHLTPLFLNHTTWADWRAHHPSTGVLSTATGSFRNYDRDPYIGYVDQPDLFFDVAHVDSRYPPKEWVVGIEIEGVSKAYPFIQLKKVDSPIRDQFNGRVITIEFNGQARSASVMDEAGKPLPAVMGFWFAWSTFHPDTHVYKHPEQHSQ